MTSRGGLDPVELIRERADLVEVIGETVVLRRAGRNYQGLCPFHGEKTPSFNVNPEKRIFRCFGCGEGGDVFSFVMKQRGIGFREALVSLGERYGIPVEPSPGEDAIVDLRSRIRKANEIATAYYREMLRHPEIGRPAREYLEKRGVQPAMIERFSLGFAPPGWDGLRKVLREQRIENEVAEEAGLLKPRKGGDGHYDAFRNRLIFPIQAENGHVVAFGARAIEAGDEPKYLNSPDTPLYQKGHHLYGLNLGREAIKTRDRILLMEGYLDVIAAHEAGFFETVGVLGTALTPPQARRFLRFTRRVYVGYDSDRAGQAATERGIATLDEVAGTSELDVRILRVPAGKDPDEFIRSRGPEAFEALVANATTLLQHQLEQAIAEGGALEDAESKDRAVQACKKVLHRVSSRVLRDELVADLARRLGVARDALTLEVDRDIRHHGAPVRRQNRVVPTSGRRDGHRQAEEDLVVLMVEDSRVRELVRERLVGIPLADELGQRIREHVEAWSPDHESGWEALLRDFPGEQETRFISRLAFRADLERWPDLPAAAASIVDTVAIHFWNQEHETCKAHLSEAMKAGASQEEIDELMRQIARALACKEDIKSRSGSVLPTRGLDR
jgi:DNA primase